MYNCPMRNTKSIFGVGVVLILMPLLGFPTGWKNFFITLCGLWLCGTFVFVRFNLPHGKKARYKKIRATESVASPFLPNRQTPESISNSVSQADNHGTNPQV